MLSEVSIRTTLEQLVVDYETEPLWFAFLISAYSEQNL